MGKSGKVFVENCGGMACKIGLAAVVLLLATNVLVSGEQEKLVEVPDYARLRTNVVTPHIAWAKPFFGKRLKALVIGPIWGQRETVELMQRFDIECVPVVVFSHDALYAEGVWWNWGRIRQIRKEGVLPNLREALNGSYDVILIGKAPLHQFPPETIEKLKEHLRNGTGLGYIGRRIPHEEFEKAVKEKQALDEHQFVTTGIPFERLFRLFLQVKDRQKDLPKLISFWESGKARVVVLNYDSPYESGFLTPPDGDRTELNYEYYQSLLIKAILWASRQEPEILFKDLTPHLTFERTQAEPKELSFKLLNTGKRVSVSLVLEVRSPEPFLRLPSLPRPRHGGVNRTDRVLEPVYRREGKISLASGSNDVKLALPKLPAGDYFIDLRLVSGKSNINWATLSLTVESGLKISQMKVRPEYIDLRKGKPEINVEVNLSEPLSNEANLELTIMDNYDRLLSRKDVSIGAGKDRTEAVLPVADIRSTVGRVRAELRVGNQTVGIGTALFTVINRPWKDFTFFSWGGAGNHYLDWQRVRALADFGVDALRGTSLSYLEVADLRGVQDFWGTGHQGRTKVKNNISEPCYTDPEFRIKLCRDFQSLVRSQIPFDVFGYMHGDESAMLGEGGAPAGEICWSDTCIANFRRWLENEYKTIAALNEEWGTNYASFGEVMPITMKEMQEKAKKTKSYAPLIDQWRFNYFTYADMMRLAFDALKEVKEVNPDIRIGGSTPLWNWWWRGYDWASIMPYYSYFTPYGPWGDRYHCEAGRSFAKPGTILSFHNGSYEPEEFYNEAYYRLITFLTLLHGCGNFFWYSLTGDSPAFFPDFNPLPCFKATSETVELINRGIGRLLLGAKREDDGIALHYSLASYLFSWFGPYPQNSEWTTGWRINSYISALEEIGFQYKLVSTQEILNGKLENYRVLILPASQAIGKQEAEKIKQFVEKGGLLIAEARPGYVDEHGKFDAGKENLLWQLFGLKWQGEPFQPLEKRNVQFAGEYKGKTFSGPPVEVEVDRSVILDGASAVIELDGVPLITHHQVGKGSAICMNTIIEDNAGAHLRNVLGVLLSAHGIEPPVKLRYDSQQFSPCAWMPGFEVSQFLDGKARYFGLTRQKQSGEAATCFIRFGQKGHLYDLLTGKYLGLKSEWKTKISPLDVHLYALLPYRLQGLTVDLAKKSWTQGQNIIGQVSLKIDRKEKELVRHVIHLKVIRPDGREVRYLAQNLETKTGKIDFQIPLSLNEPKGSWNITFSDVASQVKKVLTVQVE